MNNLRCKAINKAKQTMKTPLSYLSLMALMLLQSAWAITPLPGPLPGPLVQPDWLMAQAVDSDRVILDIQEPQLFARHHVPGAVNWPFSQWRTGTKGKPPKSLPPLAQLTTRLGDLGISAATPVVIVATGTGPGDLSASARVFWTLKVLGHEPVAVLNGGLIGYVNDHHGAYAGGKAEARTPTVYQAQPRLELLATTAWLPETAMPRLDARSQAEYVGLVSGGSDERPGTLPGAHHLPFDWLTDDSGGRLRPIGQLRTLFGYAGLGEQAAVHFCHTGNRAALTWFVDYALLGHRRARLYDGSMLEWSRDASLPIERKIPLPRPTSE